MRLPAFVLRLLLVLPGLVFAGAASGQSAGPPPPPINPDPRIPVHVLRVDFGWDGVVPSDRWAPVVVWLWSGERAFHGSLELEYKQDATQRGRIVLGVSTTPGQVVPFEMCAAIPYVPSFGPSGQQAMTLTIADADSGWDARYEFAAVPSGRGQLPEPRVDPNAVIAVLVGDSSAWTAFHTGTATPQTLEVEDQTPAGPQPPAVGQWMPGQQVPTDLWARAMGCRRPAATLPLAWAAYDGVEVVIAQADALAKADPRAREALLTWVMSGGRLILLLDGAGGWWTQFLPTTGELVVADEPRIVRPGPDALAALKTQGVAAPIPARVLRVTPAGRLDGWRASWSVEGGDASSGLVARGPLGMGVVMLLGVDPQRLPPVVAHRATAALWRELVAGEDLGVLPRHVRTIDPNASNYYWSMGSGSTPEVSSAIRTVLDAISQVPPISGSVFVIIAASMVALAAMLGPVDRIVLRRKGWSRWSWVSALAWIVLASLTAYAAPTWVRSGRTVVTRASVRDAVGPGPGGPALECRTGLTGVFAGRPLRSRVEPTRAAWWRGISPMEWYRGNAGRFTIVEAAVDTASPRGLLPGPLRQGQWTFRTLLDQRPPVERSIAEWGPQVVRVGSDWSVAVRGLPEGAVVRTGALQTREGWWLLSFAGATTERGDSVFHADARVMYMLAAPPDRWVFKAPIGYYWQAGTGASTFASAASLNLPGVRSREEAATLRVAGGGWAMVLLEVTGLPDDSGFVLLDADRATTVFLRMVVPLSASDRPDEGSDTP
jgi:hypothetical protein